MKNKKSPHRILWILLAVIVLVLFWAASEHRLRPAYIGIAKLENKIKGIDGSPPPRSPRSRATPAATPG